MGKITRFYCTYRIKHLIIVGFLGVGQKVGARNGQSSWIPRIVASMTPRLVVLKVPSTMQALLLESVLRPNSLASDTFTRGKMLHILVNLGCFLMMFSKTSAR